VHSDSILDTTTVPATISSKSMEEKIFKVARDVLECFQGVGTFCAELFITKKGEVLVNEVAPRVHNSGHYTIEAVRTSQFENHIRAICGLPLGSTELLVPFAVMKNIIGPFSLDAVYKVLENAGTSLHLYGKEVAKPGRKMGHITVTGEKEHVQGVVKQIG